MTSSSYKVNLHERWGPWGHFSFPFLAFFSYLLNSVNYSRETCAGSNQYNRHVCTCLPAVFNLRMCFALHQFINAVFDNLCLFKMNTVFLSYVYLRV